MPKKLKRDDPKRTERITKIARNVVMREDEPLLTKIARARILAERFPTPFKDE